MSDPLDYMNSLCKWTNPPEPSDQWERKIALACEWLSNRDKTIEAQQVTIDNLQSELDAERLWIKEGKKLHAVQKEEIEQLKDELANMKKRLSCVCEDQFSM
jgi:chromosome segregation ATPase